MQQEITEVQRVLRERPMIYQVLKIASEIGTDKIQETALGFLKKNLKSMRTEDIRIFQCFKENPPKSGKMLKKEQYFNETGLLQSEIILDGGNNLIDGYTSYLLAVEHGLEYVPIRYGKRQIIKAYHRQGGKLYAWELLGKLIDKVSPGEKLIVRTNRGFRKVTVAAVEDYNPEQYIKPLRQAIRRKRKGAAA